MNLRSDQSQISPATKEREGSTERREQGSVGVEKELTVPQQESLVDEVQKCNQSSYGRLKRTEGSTERREQGAKNLRGVQNK